MRLLARPAFRALAALPLGIILIGCDGGDERVSTRAEQRVTAEQRRDRDAANQAEQKWVDGMQAGVRIQALQKRVDQLEREVAELKMTPERLNLDLLTQRVTRLEARTSAGTVPADAGPGAATSGASSAATKSTTPAKPTRRPGSLELDLH